MGTTRSAMSSCRQSTRSAEQRWPAESKAEVSASSTSCSGKADESTTIAFCPPVSAISTGGRPSALSRWASCRLIDCATSVEPVNTTPATAGLPTSRATDLAVARQELQRRARHARLVQQRHGERGDQRRLLGRLGDHRIARRQRARDLAGEDRQREVPRADAGDHAQRPMRVVRESFDAACVVAQEVDRFAHLAYGVAKGLAGLAHDRPQQRLEPRLHQVGGPPQDRGARRRRRLPRPRLQAGRIDHVGRRLDDRADHVAAIGRIGHRLRSLAVARPVGQHRHGGDRLCRPATSRQAPPAPARWPGRARASSGARRTGRAAARCADAARRPAAAPAPARPGRPAACRASPRDWRSG